MFGVYCEGTACCGEEAAGDGKMNIKKIKDIVKKVVDYHIEGDYHVYTVKNTPLSIRILMTRKYNKKWAKLPINSRKIIFDNYMGSGYGCNGKYITEELLREHSDAEIVFVSGTLKISPNNLFAF